MNGLLLHCGSEKVTREDVFAVPVPKHTDSYKPVPYRDAIELLHNRAKRVLGMEVRDEQYGLNQAGDQMFAILTLDTGADGFGLSIGIRQSYNKSLALGVAAGQRVFVCDNLCFSGEAFKVVRKNTVNVWSDFTTLLDGQMGRAFASYQRIGAQCEAMRAHPCSQREGYAMLGVMLGTRLLTSQQATIAFGDWTEPRHEDFAERNLWSLYNCVTEGLKKGPPARTIDRHVKAHDFFVSERPGLQLA